MRFYDSPRWYLNDTHVLARGQAAHGIGADADGDVTVGCQPPGGQAIDCLAHRPAYFLGDSLQKMYTGRGGDDFNTSSLGECM